MLGGHAIKGIGEVLRDYQNRLRRRPDGFIGLTFLSVIF